MHRALIWITYVLSYNGFTFGDPVDWNKELDDIASKLGSIENEIMFAVDGISTKVDSLSKKLDGITKEVESQKSTVGDIKRSLETYSGKEEIEKLINKINSYGEKQLKDQQSTREALNTQKVQLTGIKDLATTGFSKVLEKLISISDGEKLKVISEGVNKLATVYTKQEDKLNKIQDTLQQTSNSIDRARNTNANDIEQLWKNVSVTLNEQNSPLSLGAATHVSKAVTITNIVGDKVSGLKDLEPKLVHALRLSQDIQKKLDNNDLSQIANNLTNSLKSLEASTPLIVSSVSKNVNDLEVVLAGLKAMSKHNDCPLDLTSEIRDHHNEVLKYLNNTKLSSNVDKTSNDVWRALMDKLEKIETGSDSNANIHDKLRKLSEDISDVRKSLQDHFGEAEPEDDVVFG